MPTFFFCALRFSDLSVLIKRNKYFKQKKGNILKSEIDSRSSSNIQIQTAFYPNHWNSRKKMKFLLLVTIFLCYASSTTSLTDQYLDSYEEYNILSSEEDENHENKNLSVEGCKVNYKYTIWIGDAVDETCSIKLQSECGTNFFDAMKQASQVEKQFDFEYTTHPAYGAFVTKIAGVSNNKEEWVRKIYLNWFNSAIICNICTEILFGWSTVCREIQRLIIRQAMSYCHPLAFLHSKSWMVIHICFGIKRSIQSLIIPS